MNKHAGWTRGVLAIVVGCLVVANFPGARADSSLALQFRRTMGVGLGNYIEGRFTLSASGNESVRALHLFFNDQEVANATGNALTFVFDTKDYPTGETTIRVTALDANGHHDERAVTKTFLSPWVGYGIMAAVGVLVVGVLVARVRQARHKDRA